MKRKLVQITIIIIILVLLLLLGWLLYDKYAKNNNSKDDDVVVIDDSKKDDGTVTGRLEPGEVLTTNSTVKELSKIFTTYQDDYSNYYKYASIKKLSGNVDTNLKLFFTFYALDIDKKSKSIKCSDVKVKGDGEWKCGFPDPEKTTAFDEKVVNEKFKYLFGSNQTINVKEAEFGIQKLIYDEANKAWILFANGKNITSGEYAKTKIDGAYVDDNTLTINIVETLESGEEQTVAVEFDFDEKVNHYVFSNRILDEEVEFEH